MARRLVSAWVCRGACLILCITTAGCAGDGSTSDTGTQQPPASLTPPRAATDCSSSTTPVGQTGVTQGVSASTTTDATGTSLLLKNTGQLSLVVVPAGATRLTEAPDASPGDEASMLALNQVARTFTPSAVPGLRVGVNGAFVVPAEWAVCALTDQLGTPAGVEFLSDKASTAKYTLAKAVFDFAEGRLTPPQLARQESFTACVQGVDTVLRTRPELNGFDLYAETVGTGFSCRSIAQLASNSDAPAAESRLLALLKKSPTLIENGRLVAAFVRL